MSEERDHVNFFITQNDWWKNELLLLLRFSLNEIFCRYKQVINKTWIASPNFSHHNNNIECHFWKILINSHRKFKFISQISTLNFSLNILKGIRDDKRCSISLKMPLFYDLDNGNSSCYSPWCQLYLSWNVESEKRKIIFNLCAPHIVIIAVKKIKFGKNARNLENHTMLHFF